MRNNYIISVKDHKQDINLTVKGLYFFQGFQVLESYTPQNDECYYLFFYKHQFLTGKKTPKIKQKSYLKQILTKGVSISSPHPLLISFLSNKSISTFPSLNTLWKNINNSFQKDEAFHILSAFDCYLKKEDILALMKKSFLQFRRSGKFLHAYRILQLAREKYPTNKWATSLITHMDYQKYSIHYQSEIETLLTYDPLYAENQLYLHKETEHIYALLQKRLRSESRIIECLSLHCNYLSTNPQKFDDYFHDIKTILQSNFTKQETIDILYTLYNHQSFIENKTKIQEQLLFHLKSEKLYKDIFLILTDNKVPLSLNQTDLLIEAITHLDAKALSFDTFLAENLTSTKNQQLEKLIVTLLPKLFEAHDIKYTYNWLKPLMHMSLPSINTIKKMYEISEEPDKQLDMGELYYELKQLPQAIDCFLWDIEMNPTNSSPIKWLIKLYGELGMTEESKTYQYLYKEIQKSS
ncbi:tetratricopeptide (TPR) repeat protein [Metabacillus crassostreae]|uniref:hypothetical protein n=1 Tax=Metabacillus crassostreae TaxID=929098 RepID=UPI001957A80F|nr:hypothetical protein [Metabacillus crassostreae]MBM7605057.1 tetratricopeptide (TPR) repeat protein [Metabacillus crassostreae]